MRYLVLASAAAILAGCAAPDPSDDATPTPSAPAPSAPTQATPSPTPTTPSPEPPLPAPTLPVEPTGPLTVTTAMHDNAFDHPRLEVLPLTTVTWKNLDDETHSIIGDVGVWVGSGPIAPGSEFSQTFEKPGEYRYTCRYHAGMAGVVVVA